MKPIDCYQVHVELIDDERFGHSLSQFFVAESPIHAINLSVKWALNRVEALEWKLGAVSAHLYVIHPPEKGGYIRSGLVPFGEFFEWKRDFPAPLGEWARYRMRELRRFEREHSKRPSA